MNNIYIGIFTTCTFNKSCIHYFHAIDIYYMNMFVWNKIINNACHTMILQCSTFVSIIYWFILCNSYENIWIICSCSCLNLITWKQLVFIPSVWDIHVWYFSLGIPITFKKSFFYIVSHIDCKCTLFVGIHWSQTRLHKHGGDERYAPCDRPTAWIYYTGSDSRGTTGRYRWTTRGATQSVRGRSLLTMRVN